MVVPAPWTQSLHLTWRPELRFYEQRVALLKKFEEQGILRAFRVEESFVDAQLFQSRDRLTVKKDGVDLQLLSPQADPDRALEALKVALEEVEPAYPRSISVSFQYIVSIELEFDEAVKRGRKRVLGPLPGEIEHQDWAVMTDFVLADLEARGTVEFGVIKSEEAPSRLARLAGRAGEQRNQGLARWRQEEFPDVAIFSDGTIIGTAEPEADTLALSAAAFWGAARSTQESLVEGLCTMLTTDDLRRVEAK